MIGLTYKIYTEPDAVEMLKSTDYVFRKLDELEAKISWLENNVEEMTTNKIKLKLKKYFKNFKKEYLKSQEKM